MDIAGQKGFDECNRPGSPPRNAQCIVDHATQITVDVIVAFALLYFAVTCILLLSKLRSYRKLPYTFVQVGLVYNTLQVELQWQNLLQTLRLSFSLCVLFSTLQLLCGHCMQLILAAVLPYVGRCE